MNTTPCIQRLDLEDFHPDIPNLSFHAASEGSLFIGKKNGLSIHCPAGNRFLNMEGPVFVTDFQGDTLCYAAKDDLGYLIRDKKKQWQLHSLQHRLPESHRHFIPSGMLRRGKRVFINGSSGLMVLYQGRIRKAKNTSAINQPQPWNGKFRLRDGEIIISTPEGDLQALDSTGEILFHLGIMEGITSRDIQQVEQSGNNIWILQEYTLHRIPYPVQLRTMDMLYACSGPLNRTLIMGESVIIGGKGGLFRLSSTMEGESFDLSTLAGSDSGAFHHLDESSGTLIAGGSRSLLAIRNNEVHKLYDGRITGLMALDNTAVLAGTPEGLIQFSYQQNQWTPVPVDTLLTSAHSFSQKGKAVLFTNGSVNYTYEHGTVSKLDSSVVLTAPTDLDFRQIPILETIGKIIDLDSMDQTLLVTTREKIIFYVKGEAEDSREILLHVEPLDPINRQEHAFVIGGLNFQEQPVPKFRYRLLPWEKHWSEWNSSRQITFQGLKHGSYILEVEGMDLFGKIVGNKTCLFRVDTPLFQRWYALSVYGLILVFLFLFVRKLNMLRYRRAESRVSRKMQSRLDFLTREKEKSDAIVAEILPRKTAEQLRKQGKAKWDKYERATVLFSDIQGFTKIAEEMNPEALIDELDQFFFHFDSVVDRYNIEKIKTIGDAYMAAGGIPKKNSTNPVEVVLAALEMQIYMRQLKSSKTNIWDLRIGIHTGPVIAGVVGHKKMSYDIWGDTVNTASRMESSGEPGKVNISGITYGMIKEYFICEYRGKLPVKYKGNIDMYFVNGLRPELSVDLKGIPNKRFNIKLQLLRLGDLEDRVFEQILDKLGERLPFHHPEYARKVYNHSYLLSRAEEIEQEERLLTRTAALMLFTGLSQAYNNYENRSAVLCREILPEYDYSESQVDRICNMILATKQPHEPNNRLEKILIDAKMEYLGRPDYHERIKDLLKEYQENGIKMNAQQFKKLQLELLYNFEFFTIAAKRLREVSGEQQMTILEEERWI